MTVKLTVIQTGTMGLQRAFQEMAAAYNRLADAQDELRKHREAVDAEWRENQKEAQAINREMHAFMRRYIPYVEREIDDAERADEWKSDEADA